MLDVGISSTARIARSWGLADDQDVADAEGRPQNMARNHPLRKRSKGASPA